MNRFLGITLLLVASGAWAQHPHDAPAAAAQLLPGLGGLHHAVSTANAEAQQFFDQGLRLAYGFNHDEAKRSFERAAQLDPKLAMAWWGVAYVVGPNYNLPVDPQREKIAYEAIQKALSLSATASPAEKAYIRALAERYSSASNADYQMLAQKYANAMRGVYQQYPDDPDAGALFAESMMNLRPWELWNHDGTPAPGTAEIVATLESVLRRQPGHMGALHFYIHAIEASPTPELALPAADRLRALNLTGAGHLVHMPGHIYFRTGDYDATVRANVAADKADENYEKVTGVQRGVYPMMYHAHNMHFLAIAAAMQGRCNQAVDAAAKLRDHVTPALDEMEMVQVGVAAPRVIGIRCQRWDDVLKAAVPDAKYKVVGAMSHYSRGIALAAAGKTDAAAAEEKQLAGLVGKSSKDELLRFDSNMPGVFEIALHVLQARLAEARGDRAGALKFWRDAVALQDQQNYDEPPDWYYPVRESLGGALLRAGDAKAAEQVFRDDLARNPRNPRSLFGLAEALKLQGREYDAAWVHQEFEAAWKGADVPISVDGL